MAEVRVQRVEQAPQGKLTKRELYAMLCYYYPQYKLQDAQNMPARDLNLLIRTARKIEGAKMYDLTLIVASPNSSDKDSVKNLLDQFAKRAKGQE